MKILVVRSRPPTQNNHKGETVAGLWEQQHAGRFTAETRDRKCLRDDVLKTVDMLGLLNSLCYFVETLVSTWWCHFLSKPVSVLCDFRIRTVWQSQFLTGSSSHCTETSSCDFVMILNTRVSVEHVTVTPCSWTRCSNICPAELEALRSTSSAPEWDHHLFMELCTRLLSRWRNTKCEQHVSKGSVRIPSNTFMGSTLYWWRVCGCDEPEEDDDDHVSHIMFIDFRSTQIQKKTFTCVSMATDPELGSCQSSAPHSSPAGGGTAPVSWWTHPCCQLTDGVCHVTVCCHVTSVILYCRQRKLQLSRGTRWNQVEPGGTQVNQRNQRNQVEPRWTRGTRRNPVKVRVLTDRTLLGSCLKFFSVERCCWCSQFS